MHFKPVLVVLPALLACSSAHPSAESLDKRDYITVGFTSDTNGAGLKESKGITTQTECHSFKGDALDKQISTIIIPNGYRCRLWSSYVCNDASSGDIASPGSRDLNTIGFNDKASSFKCYIGST